MFAIVTANWNGEKLLNTFLESLYNQTYNNFILYIVDNGSTDRSIEIINNYKSKLNINVIELDENLGFSQANNIAINEAMKDECKYIITLNNDIELEENCFLQIKENIEKSQDEYDVFQMLILNFYNRNMIDSAGISFNSHYGVNQIGYKMPYESLKNFNNDIDGVCAGAAVYSKDCLKAVKINGNEYFDSIFFAYYEDADLALRLRNAGYKSNLIKEAKAYHIHSGTSGKDSYFKSYYLSRNTLIYLRKNLSKELFKKNQKVYFYNFITKIIKLLVKINFGAIHGTLRGYVDYKKLIKQRKI